MFYLELIYSSYTKGFKEKNDSYMNIILSIRIHMISKKINLKLFQLSISYIARNKKNQSVNKCKCACLNRLNTL